jgi:PAS domain S-box-containing protein
MNTKTSSLLSPFDATLKENSGRAPASHWSDMGESEHFVQFYEDDAFLVESVGEFIGAGLGAGHGAIVIATSAHRKALERRLRDQGVDVSAVKARGQFVPLDAAETLSMFMVNGMPDSNLFNEVVGTLVVKVTEGRRGLKAFGEMVALLWADGNGDAAIRLEQLWNDLAKTHSFALFCAYPMQGFKSESHGTPFLHICQEHTRVIPAESYAAKQRTDEERLRTIAVLQQKSAALEAEMRERSSAEEALRRCNDELTSFFENATIGLHWVRDDGIIKWANRAEYELLGYTKEEYIGRNISEIHADDEVIADILTRLCRAETLKNYEARLRCKDGSIKNVVIDSTVLWDKGRFVHTQCFTRDITEQKKAERELRDAHDKLAQSNEELERRVIERTQKLKETIGELEAFSYSISHDMRSPLRAMYAHAEALLIDCKSKLEPEEVDLLERIRRAATRLDLLVRDVLAYSKVSQSQISLQSVALDGLVDDIIHEQFENSRDRIIVEHPLHAVVGHEAYLTQCISNLVNNGLKFIRPGTTPRVRVQTELAGDKVRFSVSDNGVGIKPEHYGRIFQMFGRVYPEKDFEGTGIGLCIVKRAINRMGGEVGFSSEAGKGSTFWFTLPRVAS